jgi:hypothetical protein
VSLWDLGKGREEGEEDERDDKVDSGLESRDNDVLDSVDSSVGSSDDLVQDGESSLHEPSRSRIKRRKLMSAKPEEAKREERRDEPAD